MAGGDGMVPRRFRPCPASLARASSGPPRESPKRFERMVKREDSPEVLVGRTARWGGAVGSSSAQEQWKR